MAGEVRHGGNDLLLAEAFDVDPFGLGERFGCRRELIGAGFGHALIFLWRPGGDKADAVDAEEALGENADEPRVALGCELRTPISAARTGLARAAIQMHENVLQRHGRLVAIRGTDRIGEREVLSAA